MRNYFNHSVLIFVSKNHTIAFFAKKQLTDNFVIPSSYFSRVLEGSEPLGLKDETFACHLSQCFVPEFDRINNKGFDDLPLDETEGKYIRFYLGEFENNADLGLSSNWIERRGQLFEEHSIPLEFQQNNRELCIKLLDIYFIIVDPNKV